MYFGSVCSGIEAASVAFKPIGFKPYWFSEIGKFPSRVLEHHYPTINNYGDMNNLPEMILNGKIPSPELLCGGTPCQAFSFAGWKNGLSDSRGQLTLKFIEIADSIDYIRKISGKPESIILWENVVGVLNDKTNAFGIFISGLAGLSKPLSINRKWSPSGILKGPKRNIAWRILDAKYFGLPHQRKRLFLVAMGKDCSPENILFERTYNSVDFSKYYMCPNTFARKNDNVSQMDLFNSKIKKNSSLVLYKNNQKFEVFRDYTDCLYSAYGTKWNGNAAAYNGSLYISQNDKLRRLTPLECERLMGFPDDYTLLPTARDTNRYQAIGNSWAIPVIEWLGTRIKKYSQIRPIEKIWLTNCSSFSTSNEHELYLFNCNFMPINSKEYINFSVSSNDVKIGDIFDIIDENPKEKFFISKVGCKGILRRCKNLKNNMNARLEKLLCANT